MSGTREVLSIQLPCDRRAPAWTREALAESDQLGLIKQDAILTASELVSDVVLRSDAQPARTLHVRVDRSADRVIISVHSSHVGHRPADSNSAQSPPSGGLGLLIVEQLAQRWGSEHEDGYRIWAELAVSA